MAPSNDGVRKRKSGQKNGGGNSGDGPVVTKSESPPSTAGMTCFNWLLVLFFIFLVGGGTAFFIHQEMTITNRALMKEIQLLKKDSELFSDVKDQIKNFEEVLASVKQMQEQVDDIQTKTKKVFHEVALMRSTIQMSETNFANLRKTTEASINDFKSAQQDVEEIKKQQSSEPSETKESLSRINDQIAVLNTNVASLSSEITRLDRRVEGQFDQVSSIQNDVISLTADKTETSALVESIKSTIVDVRDRVETLEKGHEVTLQYSESKFQELEAKATTEFTRISREISEQRENSAKWLQESTNDLTSRFQTRVEELAAKFDEIKVKAEQPTSVTDYEAVVNSVALLDKKLSELSEEVKKLDARSQDAQKEEKSGDKEQLDRIKEDIATLTSHLRSAKSKDEQFGAKLEEMTREVTTLSNELRGLTTTTRILESRVEEMKGENEKLKSTVTGRKSAEEVQE